MYRSVKVVAAIISKYRPLQLLFNRRKLAARYYNVRFRPVCFPVSRHGWTEPHQPSDIHSGRFRLAHSALRKFTPISRQPCPRAQSSRYSLIAALPRVFEMFAGRTSLPQTLPAVPDRAPPHESAWPLPEIRSALRGDPAPPEPPSADRRTSQALRRRRSPSSALQLGCRARAAISSGVTPGAAPSRASTSYNGLPQPI